MLLETAILSLTLVSLASLFLLWWYQTFSHFFIYLKKIPGPASVPFVGNVENIVKNPEELFQKDRKLAVEFYPIYREWLFVHGVVKVLHPDDIELVLSSSKHNDKSSIYGFLHSWLGTGLLTSGGAKWHRRRKILTPAFHFSILQEFIPIFNEEAQKMVGSLKRKLGEGPMNLMDPVTQFTLVSIAETSMGVKLDASPESLELYKKAIYDFGSSLVYRMSRIWLLPDILHTFSRNIIDEKKKSIPESFRPGKRQAMLDLLLSVNGIDDEGIAEEVDTFMFEGHDTTSLAISYALLLLAKHRDAQDRVFEEIRSVLGHPIAKPPNYNNLKQLTFMEMVIKETLRLYPSVPIIGRKASEDIKTTTGYIIPKNAMVHVHIVDLHRNPRIYPDPLKFDPERFAPENVKNRHPFAYLPFSAGPRNCIGQRFAILELKAVLCAILDNFVLEPEDDPENLTMIADLVLRSKEKPRVRFISRDLE